MSYTLTAGETKLPRAVALLESWHDEQGACLGRCRAALLAVGLVLPPPVLIEHFHGRSTAINCFRVLAGRPGQFGWRPVHGPNSVHPVTLNFYQDCGLENGTYCGHVALKRGAWLYSSEDYPDSESWQEKLVGQFIPV